MRATKGHFVKSPVAFVCVVVTACCLLVLIISIFKLPEISVADGSRMTSFGSKPVLAYEKMGKFGAMVIEMLPEDLAFTVFVPSERAFERDLRLSVNDSLSGEKYDNTYAILTRILGFSAVPRTISSVSVPIGKGVSYDSVSGFSLYISKEAADGVLIVNRVRSKHVDLRKGKIFVHIMDGVIMDSEFEESVQPDYNEDG